MRLNVSSASLWPSCFCFDVLNNLNRPNLGARVHVSTPSCCLPEFCPHATGMVVCVLKETEPTKEVYLLWCTLIFSSFHTLWLLSQTKSGQIKHQYRKAGPGASVHAVQFKTLTIHIVSGANPTDKWQIVRLFHGFVAWASYQICKIAVCACARNAGNIFPAPNFKGNR